MPVVSLVGTPMYNHLASPYMPEMTQFCVIGSPANTPKGAQTQVVVKNAHEGVP